MSPTALQFDPYLEWLEIPPHESALGGPDHYRLLGLARFETDMLRIAAAADERMAKVRTFQVGPRGRFTQQLLNELAAAKVCLLSPPAKRAYDENLSQAISAALAQQRQSPPAFPSPRAGHCSHDPLDQADSEFTQPQSAAAWMRIVLSITAAALVVLIAVLIWVASGQRQHVSPRQAVNHGVHQPAESEPEFAAQPTLQAQEGSGEVTLTAATAKLAGGVELRHAGAEPVLANWTAKDAQAEWRFRLIQPGFFNVELAYATAAEALGSTINLTIGRNSKTIDLRATGGLAQLHTETTTIAVPASGQHTFVVHPETPLGGDWFVLRSVRLIPVGGPAPPAILPEPQE